MANLSETDNEPKERMVSNLNETEKNILLNRLESKYTRLNVGDLPPDLENTVIYSNKKFYREPSKRRKVIMYCRKDRNEIAREKLREKLIKNKKIIK